MKKNSLKTILPIIIALSLAPAVLAQVITKDAKYIRIPADFLPILIAYQPDCPLKIEEVRAYIRYSPNLPSTNFVTFKVRNVSKKSVRLADFTQISISGTSGDLFSDDSKQKVIPPNGTEVYNEIPPNSEIALTDKLKEDFDLKKRRTVIVLFVKEVLFTDGSTYGNLEFYDKLFNYLTELSEPDDD